MALPISPTPVLKGKEANRFLAKVDADCKNPIGLTPTPKLSDARARVKQHASRIKK